MTIDGIDVRDMSFETLASAVGVVFQEAYLFHASVADNLRFAKPDATDSELIEAARVAQIHDHLMSLPNGYETVVGERPPSATPTGPKRTGSAFHSQRHI